NRFSYVDGEAHLVFTDRVVETATLTARYLGSPAQDTSIDLPFVAVAPSSVFVTPSTLTPEAGATVTLTVTLADGFGNPVAATSPSDVSFGPAGTPPCNARSSPPTPADLATACYGTSTVVNGAVILDLGPSS